MVLLTLTGLAAYPALRGAILGVGAALLAAVALVQIRPAAERLLRWVDQLPILATLGPRLSELYESTRVVLAPSMLAVSVPLGFVAWGCEGAISLLPGGLGITDGSLVGLSLWIVGLDRSTAVAAALLIRLATLWFGMGLGIVALVALRGSLSADLGLGPSRGEQT